MEFNDYYIFPEEKQAVKKILEEDRLQKLNYIISGLESNLFLTDIENKKWKTYFEADKILEELNKIYLAIFKQELNKKNQLKKVYIPMELKEYEAFKKEKEYYGILAGTKDEFVAKTKDYGTKDIIIVEAELKNIPAYVTEEEFNILETVLLAPPFSINDFKQIEEKEGRTFVKFGLNNINIRMVNKDSKTLLEAISKDQALQANNFEEYFAKEKENFEISKKLNELKQQLLDVSEKEKAAEAAELEEQEQKEEKKESDLSAEIDALIAKFTDNQEQKQNLLEQISNWKRDIREYVEKIFSQALIEIEKEKRKIAEAKNLTEKEKEFFAKIELILKLNKDEAEKILQKAEKLIKVEQRLAKIGADCGVNYIAIADGFKIREKALELSTLMKNIYQDYQDYYITMTKYGKKNEVKEERYRNILKEDNQIGILINYFNNAKEGKPETAMDRFDEIAILEENELKRKISQYVFKNIAKAHIELINREIDIQENKTALEKLLIFLKGKKNIEDFKISENEYKLEKIEQLINREFTIEQNYKIHEILAYIMMFKRENEDLLNQLEKETSPDSEYEINEAELETYNLLKKTMGKLDAVEETLNKNFDVDVEKVIEIMIRKSPNSLPATNDHNVKELDKIENETNAFLNQYGYNEKNMNNNTKYSDTVANELKKIIDYAKIIF